MSLDKGVTDLNPSELKKICETNQNFINRALVVDIVDKQSVSLALKVYSPEVEGALWDNNAHKEANYVYLIPNWYEAVDTPGISDLERVKK